MDRTVLWAALLVSAVLISCGAYLVLQDYANPVFVNGADTAQRIDANVGDLIAARFPGVPVGAARCPLLLNLTGKHTGRCVVPVADGELRVDVVRPFIAGLAAPLRDVDAVFVTRGAERSIRAKLLERYGEPFDVHCPGPDVRVIADRSTVTCSVEASDVLRRGIEVTVSGDGGDVRPEELISVATRAARTFGADVATRTAGSVVLSGRATERYVLATAGADADGEVGRRGLLGAVHCPPRIVLHEGDHATCTVQVGGRALTYDVGFEKGPGLSIRSDRRIEVIAVLSEFATRYFERPKFTEGKPLRARVGCGTDSVAFVEPGSSVPCSATVGTRRYSFAFEFDDADGDFTIALE